MASASSEPDVCPCGDLKDARSVLAAEPGSVVRETVEWPSGEDSLSGVLVRPDPKAHPVAHGGVLVLCDIFGFNRDHQLAVCDRLAATGMIAFSPDMFHGAAPWGDGLDWADFPAWREALDTSLIDADCRAATRFLAGLLPKDASGAARKVCISGFCFGGKWALTLAKWTGDATADASSGSGSGSADSTTGLASPYSSCVAICPGRLAPEDGAGLQCPTLMIAGEKDTKHTPPEVLAAFQAAADASARAATGGTAPGESGPRGHSEVRVSVYPGMPHGFVHRTITDDTRAESEKGMEEFLVWVNEHTS